MENQRKYLMANKLKKSDAEWRSELSPDVYHITRAKGTEPPFSGKYVDMHEKGMYKCSNCGADLFSSDTKFDSGSGWPSFWAPHTQESVELSPDPSREMERTEVVCNRCGAHLGHVFDDGPKPTGKRFCINSLSLDFEKTKGEEK